MNPLRLHLTNFVSYVDEDVDLGTIHVAALVGRNGAGKSSFVEAIAWALFGEGPRGGKKAASNYVRMGADECTVELDFELAGERYRVVRTWNLKKGQSLEFYRFASGTPQPVSGKGVSDTQALIESCLRMDYETFISSALALQGQADAFTSDRVKDQDRKRILASVLGLDVWDKLETVVKDKSKDAKASLALAQAEQERLELIVQEIPGFETSLAEANKRASFAEQTRRRLENEIAEVKAAVAATSAVRAQVESLSAQLARELSRRETLILDEQRTRKAFADLAEVRRAKIEKANKAIADLEALVARSPEIAQARLDVERISKEITALEDATRERAALLQELSVAERKRSALERDIAARVGRLQSEMAQAVQLAATLDEVPCAKGGKYAKSCPLLKEALAASQRIAELQTEIDAAEASRPSDDEIVALQARLDGIVVDRDALDKLREELGRAKKIADEAAALALAESRKRELAAEIAELEEAMTQGKVDFETKIAEITRERSTVESEIEKLNATISELRSALGVDRSAELAALEAQVAAARADETRIQHEIGKILERLDVARKAEEDLARTLEAVDRAAREVEVYRYLLEAVGKKSGVPAFIMENAIPAIEGSANEILGTISAGRFSVRFDTQVDLKGGGERDALRVVVIDGSVDRPYQTFSGGEKMIVDLAIRVAIARFLAQRAGTEIKILVIDEGVAALDEVNRGEVVAAIMALGKRFDKVLVITHVSELKDAFPQQLVFQNAGGSSHVEVDLG